METRTKRGTVITVANQKGGVGKTALTRVLIDYALTSKKRVLAIDFDPQATLTKGYGLTPEQYEGNSPFNVSNIFLKKDLEIISKEIDAGVIHIIPSNRSLGEVGQSGIVGKDMKLKQFIEDNDLLAKYDYIIIDNNPKFDSMVINTTLAADTIVIPVTTGKDEQEGVHDFLRNTEEALKSYGGKVSKIALVPTMYDKNTKVGQHYLEVLNTHVYPYIENSCKILSGAEYILAEPIPFTVAFRDASSFGLSAYVFLKDYRSESSMKKENAVKIVELLKKTSKQILQQNNNASVIKIENKE